jgi:hypothetical protein
VLLSFWNVKERRKKIKLMQTLQNESKNYGLQSNYRHDNKKKKKRKNEVRIKHRPPMP